MIIEIFKLYEVVIGIGVTIAIIYLLYSEDFIIVHKGFLIFLAIGSSVSSVSKLIILFYWPEAIHFSHFLFLLFISAGLYSLIDGYPFKERPRLSTLLSQ